MKWAGIHITFLFLLFNNLHAEQAETDVGTGIVYPSVISSVQTNGAGFGFLKGEQLDLKLGPKGRMSNVGGIASYALAARKFGFGFAAEYANDKLTNFVAAGFDARYVQLGLNASFQAKTWASRGNLGLRVEIVEGFAFAATFQDIWSAASSFRAGLGFGNDIFVTEISFPATVYFLKDPPLFNPSFSFSFVWFDGLTLNLGLKDILIAKDQFYEGTTNAAIYYWLTNNIAIAAYYRQFDLEYSLGITGKLGGGS